MKKAKKTKLVPRRRTELDTIVRQLRTILRREISDVVKAGDLLIKARKLFASEHGEWQDWLAENFDLSYRTAVNYVHAAEYVARKREQKCNVSHLTNLSASVLYQLADGGYSEEEEAAILDAAREGRIGYDRASAICEKLAPPDDDDADVAADVDRQEDGSENGGQAEQDAEIQAILDGPPPKPPDGSTEHLAPPDHALNRFDFVINALKPLIGKQSADFVGTSHSIKDLESVADFIRWVAKAKAGGTPR